LWVDRKPGGRASPLRRDSPRLGPPRKPRRRQGFAMVHWAVAGGHSGRIPLWRNP